MKYPPLLLALPVLCLGISLPEDIEQRLARLESLVVEQGRMADRVRALEVEREGLAFKVDDQAILLEKLVAACNCGGDGVDLDVNIAETAPGKRHLSSMSAITRLDRSSVSTRYLNAQRVTATDMNVSGTVYLENIFINGFRWSPSEPSQAPSPAPSNEPSGVPTSQPTTAPVGTFYGTCSGAYGTYSLGSPYPFEMPDNTADSGWIAVPGCYWGLTYTRSVHVHGVQLWSVYPGGARGCNIVLAYSTDGGSSFSNVATINFETSNGGASYGASGYAGRYDYSVGADPSIRATNWRVTTASVTNGHCPRSGTAQLTIQP